MYEINGRVKSSVRGPVSDLGYVSHPVDPKIIGYDGQFIPAFLHKHKSNHRLSRQFLLMNRIGSAFEEMEPGMTVFLPDAEPFLRHPDA